MPRLPRLHVSGGTYHVVMRGNHREDVFATAEDRYALNGIVASVVERYGARVFAFCWMTNHFHLLIQIKEAPLGKIMQQIARRYSRYRHKQLSTSGHLFERRYKAWLVDTDAYFITLLRYIHRNPVSAGMVHRRTGRLIKRRYKPYWLRLAKLRSHRRSHAREPQDEGDAMSNMVLKNTAILSTHS